MEAAPAPLFRLPSAPFTSVSPTPRAPSFDPLAPPTARLQAANANAEMDQLASTGSSSMSEWRGKRPAAPSASYYDYPFAPSYNLPPPKLCAPRNQSRRTIQVVGMSVALAALMLYLRSLGVETRISLATDAPRAPTIRMVDMAANRRLATGVQDCGWSYFNQTARRSSTRGPYGAQFPARGDLPYLLTDQDQYSLGDVLTTRVLAYPHLLSHPAPDELDADFLFLPFYSLLHAEPFGICTVSPQFSQAVKDTITSIRQLAASLPSTYPRLIIPMSVVRIAENTKLFTPEIMAEIREKVILVSFESTALFVEEGLHTLIDIPYPTLFHLPLDKHWKDAVDTSFFLDHERPYLIHYAGATSHPWQAIDDGVNGFRLRGVLAQTIHEHINASEASIAHGGPASPTRVVFDDFSAQTGDDFLGSMYDHFTQSVFSLEPAGDTPTRRGFYDAVLNGAIPVVFRNSYDSLFPSSPEMDPRLFTVFIDEEEIVHGIGETFIQRLEKISPEEIRRKQEHIQRIARKLQYSLPAEDVPLPLPASKEQGVPGSMDFGEDSFSMLLKELDSIRRGKWKSRNPDR